MPAACTFLTDSAECFTASWYLIWDQIRYWLLLQVPNIFVSVIYEWLEVSNSALATTSNCCVHVYVYRMEYVYYPKTRCKQTYVNYVVERGGTLSITFSLWSIESILLIAASVSYSIRWLGAPHKFYFVTALSSLFDLLSIVSHFSLTLRSMQEDGFLKRSWLDFGFVRSYLLYRVVFELFENFKHKTFGTQLAFLIFQFCCLVFFAASMLFSLERLGDLPGFDTYLLHVYECTNSNSETILWSNSSGTPEFTDCTESWSIFVAIYFMFVTLSTVGYGDFTPKTVLGQCTVCLIIVVGIYTFANACGDLIKVYGDPRNANARYNIVKNTMHVIVTGNPSLAQIKEFVHEFFQSNHTVPSPSHPIQNVRCHKPPLLASKWLECRQVEPIWQQHIVFLLEYDQTTDEIGSIFLREFAQFLHENPKYQQRVFLLYGSPLYYSDLQRAHFLLSKAIFFLPNKNSDKANQEDANTIVRVLSVAQQTHSKGPLKLMALLLYSENRTLLEAAGIPSERIVCADEICLGLMALSCRCPGLSTLMSNLLLGHAHNVPVIPPSTPSRPHFINEYIEGASTKIFSRAISSRFAGLTFTQASQLVHFESNGAVLLIAIQLPIHSQVFWNPGQWLRIPINCNCFFIADKISTLDAFTTDCTTEMDAITSKKTIQINLRHAQALLNRLRTRANSFAQVVKQREIAQIAEMEAIHAMKERQLLANNSMWLKYQVNLRIRAKRAQHNVERRIPRAIRHFCGKKQFPLQPPDTLVLQKGGHIIVCSNLSIDGDLVPINRLMKFLLPLRATHINRSLPIVLVDTATVIGFPGIQNVFHVKASPQKHSVLVSAGLYSAFAVVVLAQGTHAHDDSSAIFNANMIDFALERDTFTMLELWNAENIKFVDAKDSIQNPHSDSNERNSAEVKNWRVKIGKIARNFSFFGEFFLGECIGKRLKRAFRSESHAMETRGNALMQERFMTGNLFPSLVADSLLIHSFQDASIHNLIHTSLRGQSCFVSYSIPIPFRRTEGVRFRAIFDVMIGGMAHALPLALLRANGEKPAYVYTLASADTMVYPKDKIVCVIDSRSLHQAACKLQRFFRLKFVKIR
uniref:Voltagegated Ion Channel (VIC) Superfamily putative n=1 Tax=Albugo laibachii Nc14 TaxID=890382 RepID=F0WUI1_9STRA|nr:Voltagegated Ion Channel (VIC) Superfamily putative [Albugo laibachii Nc14]|eukprot:CCA25062.1 Voltagegated Ion Channel (VIC) Superfamily putative [Albugo laibachii Nc14]